MPDIDVDRSINRRLTVESAWGAVAALLPFRSPGRSPNPPYRSLGNGLSTAPLVAEPGQPLAWMNIDHQWEGYFPDDPSRIRQHAQWMAGLTPSDWRTAVHD